VLQEAVKDEDNKLLKIHDVVQQLPPPHYRSVTLCNSIHSVHFSTLSSIAFCRKLKRKLATVHPLEVVDSVEGTDSCLQQC
jgi:hypothetical protein